MKKPIIKTLVESNDKLEFNRLCNEGFTILSRRITASYIAYWIDNQQLRKWKQAMITVTYSSVDGYSKTRSYKTLKGAQQWAWRCVGSRPDLGSTYAVSFDGIGKITWTGCTAIELFSELFPENGNKQ